MRSLSWVDLCGFGRRGGSNVRVALDPVEKAVVVRLEEQLSPLDLMTSRRSTPNGALVSD